MTDSSINPIILPSNMQIFLQKKFELKNPGKDLKSNWNGLLIKDGMAQFCKTRLKDFVKFPVQFTFISSLN